jgi:hypothetical protein
MDDLDDGDLARALCPGRARHARRSPSVLDVAGSAEARAAQTETTTRYAYQQGEDRGLASAERAYSKRSQQVCPQSREVVKPSVLLIRADASQCGVLLTYPK